MNDPAETDPVNDTATTVRPVRSTGRKHAEVCERLTDLARQAGPSAKLPTTAELCQLLDISVVTLNNALKTMEARGILTRRTGVGIFVAESLPERRIALLCGPQFYGHGELSPFWPHLLERIQQRGEQEHERVEMFLVNYNPVTESQEVTPDLADALQNGRYAGIISIGVTQKLSEWIATLPVPNVAFAGPGRDIIAFQQESKIGAAMETLKAQGCQKIALWQPVLFGPKSEIPAQRSMRLHDLYRQIITNLGLEFNPDLFQDNYDLLENRVGSQWFSNREQGYKLAERTFGPEPTLPRPDGLLIGDDMMTTGVLAYLRQRNVTLNRDLRICSHANKGSTVLLGWEHELTLLEADPGALVDALFARLHERISGAPPGYFLGLEPILIPYSPEKIVGD